jgi:hypothetical protein
MFTKRPAEVASVVVSVLVILGLVTQDEGKVLHESVVALVGLVGIVAPVITAIVARRRGEKVL